MPSEVTNFQALPMVLSLLNDSKYLGIHIHRKHWEKYPIVPDSFWDWALSKYGDEIDCN